MLDDALRALAEPRRREILRLVAGIERTSGEIAAHFDVTGPAVSQHLAVLAAAGLVSVRRQGTRRLYRARPEGLTAVRAFVDEFWDVALRRLVAAAEIEERRLAMATSQTADALEREVRIAARPETVFAFFTDSEKMLRWMGVSADLDPRPGGVFRINVTGRDDASGAYVEIVPYSRVVFSWGWEQEGHNVPPGASRVEITLTADGDGTIVRLRHLGLSLEDQEPHVHGWEHYLDRLAVAAAGGDAGVDPWTSPEGMNG